MTLHNTGTLGLHLQRRHLQQAVAKIGLHADELLGGRRDLESSISLVRPAQPDTKLLPPPPHQRPVYRQRRVLTTPSGPALSTGASFLSTLGMWRQGCGKYLFPHQSPFSTAEFPAALEAAASGEDRERGPARLYYYK
jgi:hypothetical protein